VLSKIYDEEKEKNFHDTDFEVKRV